MLNIILTVMAITRLVFEPPPNLHSCLSARPYVNMSVIMQKTLVKAGVQTPERVDGEGQKRKTGMMQIPKL